MVNNKDPSNYVWRLGSTQLKVSTSYRYLGETITSDCTIKNHLETKGRESTAALSTLKAITSDIILNQMSLAATLQIIDSCITPSLIYAADRMLEYNINSHDNSPDYRTMLSGGHYQCPNQHQLSRWRLAHTRSRP